jgi:dTDP-4-dehydrorhamnose reductase
VVVAMVRQVLCGADNWGLYQYVSSDICSELEFVQELAAILQETGDFRGAIVEPAEQDALQGSAVLGNQRLLDNFGVKPRTWRQGLGETVRLWLKRNPV